MKGALLELTAPFNLLFFSHQESFLVDDCSTSGYVPCRIKSLINYHTQETGRLIH